MIRYGPYFGFSHKISIIRYGSLFYDMSQILLFTSNIYFTIWQNLIYDTRPLQSACYEMSILRYEFGFVNQNSKRWDAEIFKNFITIFNNKSVKILAPHPVFNDMS